MIGRTLGHYRIIAKLGEGGMGVVYRARDERLDRDVALKVLPASSFNDPTARARLLREARAAAALNHPHICTIYEVGEADGQAYIAMELVHGQSLSALLAGGALPGEQVLRLGLQLAEALTHAHERGIVHRDLKSANVIITPEGHAKVLDFGLAKRMSGQALAQATTESQGPLTEAGALAGTLAYMAPEQLCGQPADTRTDVWALGVLLYEMATGQRPFQGDTGYSLGAAILREPSPALPADVPVELRGVVEHCLAKEPARRWQHASEVRKALEAVRPEAASPRSEQRQAVARRKRTPSRKRIRALAVLPLENLSRDPEQDYFADGMTEALITDLSKIGALKVISRTSAMQYKGVRKPLPEIGEELGVDAVIEGSVLRVGGQVRITAQLVHARTDEHLWAESYQRELRDVLALQSDVAQAIANEVRVKLTPKEKAWLTDRRRVNPAAHESYLKGRFFWNQRGRGLQKSVELFEQALVEDNTYGRAYAGLADAFALLGFYSYAQPKDVMPKAKEAARKALELDEGLAEAHASLGFVHTVFDWDWKSAEKEFQRAVALDPRYGPAHYWHTTLLMVAGAWDEAIGELRRALEYDPLSMYMQAHLGVVFLYAGRYDEASRQLRKALELEPNFFVAGSFLGISYFLESHLDKALHELQMAIESSGRHPWPVAHLGLIYAASRDRMRAVEIIRELEQRRQTEYVSAMDIASIYTQLGEVEKAFEWLEKAYAERAPLLFSLARFPLYSPEQLRNDPRFEALLRRIGLPEGN